MGYTHNDTPYYYTKNAQGDVTGIVDSDANTVVEYTYDAWGKLLSTTGSKAGTIGKLNPFLYRGYYYDAETGLYYLNSRYYDAHTGRFLNADDTSILLEDQDSLTEHNLFSYCLNNPVNMADEDGEIAWWVVAAVGGAAFDSAFYLMGAVASGHFSWGDLGKAALKGAVTGVALGTIGKGIKAISGIVKASKVAQNAKNVFSFIRASIKVSNSVNKLISSASKLKYTKTALSHLSTRPYMKSTFVIQEIMKSSNPLKDNSLKNGLKWVTKGKYNGTFGTWELVVDCSTNTIVHFLFKT